MATFHNTVVLRSDFGITQHEEGNIAVADCLPGFLVEAVGNGTFKPHSTANGASAKKFAKENYLMGCTLAGTNEGVNWHKVGERLLIHKALPQDIINVYLAAGQVVARGDYAVSMGNGKVGKTASPLGAGIIAIGKFTETVDSTALDSHGRAQTHAAVEIMA